MISGSGVWKSRTGIVEISVWLSIMVPLPVKILWSVLVELSICVELSRPIPAKITSDAIIVSSTTCNTWRLYQSSTMTKRQLTH